MEVEMRGLLAIDGMLYQYMMKVYDLIVLNLIFVVSCIPLVTIGASITALYDMTLSMQNRRAKTIYTAYLDSFQSNFKQATQVWLGFLCMVGMTVMLMNLAQGNVFVLLSLLGLMVMSLMTLIYVFALIAKFKQQTPTMIKNGLLLAIEHAPYSIIMLSIAGALVIGVPLCVHWAGLLSLVLTFSLTAYIQSYFLNKLFKKVLKRSC